MSLLLFTHEIHRLKIFWQVTACCVTRFYVPVCKILDLCLLAFEIYCIPGFKLKNLRNRYISTLQASPTFPKGMGKQKEQWGPSYVSLRREEIHTRDCWPINVLPYLRLDTVPHSYSWDVCCGPQYPLLRHGEDPTCQIWQGSGRGTARGRPDRSAIRIDTMEDSHCTREIGCGSLSMSRREKSEKCLHSHTQWRQKGTLSVVTNDISSVSHIQREQRTPLNQSRKTQV